MIDIEIGSNLKMSETQKMVFDSAIIFANQEIKPFVMSWDEKQFFPKKLFKDAGSLGFMGMLIPVEYGGAGMGYHE